VWQFERVVKLGGPDFHSKQWKCGWCDSTFKGWNATKVLHHCAKASGNFDIKPCTGPIPKTLLTKFQALRHKKLGASALKRQHKEAFSDTIAEGQQSISVLFGGNRTRTSTSSGVGKIVDVTNDSTGVEGSNATRLTAAIAEFVYSKGLSFSAVEGDHFRQILKLAKLVAVTYRPPTRKVLANELLQLSYDTRLDKYMVDLAVDADVYGISLFGDGATVHGMPLMNILASGVHESAAVLAIVDCKYLCCVYFRSDLSN
jgi:hypothetical protein